MAEEGVVLRYYVPFRDEKNCYQVFHHLSKQTGRARSPGCRKHEQNKFEPYGDLVDQTFFQFNENSIANQNSHSQVENDEKPGSGYVRFMVQKT